MSLVKGLYLAACFCSMGWPQHLRSPFPARVTMNSDPHFVHMYLLPACVAIFNLILLLLFKVVRRQSKWDKFWFLLKDTFSVHIWSNNFLVEGH